MARHFDFRDDGHASFGGEPDNVFDLLLGVETAVHLLTFGVIYKAERLGPVAVTGSEGALFGEEGILFGLHSPATVVDEVPVEDIHLVHGQPVDVALDEIYAEEVSADVKVHSAPFESGFVENVEAGDGPVDARGLLGAFDLVRKELAEGLNRVVGARFFARLNCDLARADSKGVFAGRGHKGLDSDELDCGFACACFEADACTVLQHSDQELGGFKLCRVADRG